MSADPRGVVLVGAAQRTHRGADGPPPAPVELTATAVRTALADTQPAIGEDALLRRVGMLAVVDPFSWPVPDPGLMLAGALGLDPAPRTLRSVIGGTGPVALLGTLATRIAAGELDVAVLAGGEIGTEFFRAAREGREPGWPSQPADTPPAEGVGEDRPPGHELEAAAGLIAPLMYYPLLEHAVRVDAGRTLDEQAQLADALWRRFAAVARTNRHAWTTAPPEHPGVAGERNRMAAHPYPKLLTANIQVDQAAALVVCSVEAADAAGIPAEKRVHVHTTAVAHDTWLVGERADLHRSPALRACGEATLRHARVALDDVAHLDLYSCFPSAVQIGGRELGYDPLADARSPTVTGGLTFAGGPANNYVSHSLAAMVDVLRADPGAHGLCTAVGWYMTKHGVAILGGPDTPPAATFAHHDPAVDHGTPRTVAAGAPSDATLETYTALYDRDGTPTLGIVAGLTADGRRGFGRVDGARLLEGDPVGIPVRFDGAGAAEL